MKYFGDKADRYYSPLLIPKWTQVARQTLYEYGNNEKKLLPFMPRKKSDFKSRQKGRRYNNLHCKADNIYTKTSKALLRPFPYNICTPYRRILVMIQRFCSKRTIMFLIFALVIALMLLCVFRRRICNFPGYATTAPTNSNYRTYSFFPVFEPSTICLIRSKQIIK
jgi:hypothetical protein